jgi:hypothetical protein
VLAVGGRLLHEWGNGRGDEEWVQIREKARALVEEAGVHAGRFTARMLSDTGLQPTAAHEIVSCGRV